MVYGGRWGYRRSKLTHASESSPFGGERMFKGRELEPFGGSEDYRYSQRVAVAVRSSTATATSCA